MEEALKRLQEAEAYNQQQMQQLQRALSDYEEEKQEELQQRVLELRAAGRSGMSGRGTGSRWLDKVGDSRL